MAVLTGMPMKWGRVFSGPPALLVAVILAVSGIGTLDLVPMAHGEVATSHVFYVSTDGDDTNQGTLDQPFRTIGRGVNAAASGDTVVLRNGTYSGSGNTNLTWIDRDVAIRSESNARDLCLIDCAGANGFKIFNAIGDGQRHELQFAGLTIANADTAIAVSSARWYDTAVTVGVANCVIRGSVVGLHLSSADLMMDSSSIYGNSVAGIWQSDDENFSIVNSKIRGNGIGIMSGSNKHTTVQLIEATEIVANGRGISWGLGWTDPGLTMRHCRVDSSTAGDGIAARAYVTPVVLEDCTVRDNAGTGVVTGGGAMLSLLRCDVSGNGHHGIGWDGDPYNKLKLEDVSLVGNHAWGIGSNTDFPTQAESVGVRGPEPRKKMSGEHVQIINCDIRDNAFGGVNIPGLCGACTIAGTSIVDNGGPGLILYSSQWTPPEEMPLAVNSVTVAGNSGTGIAALSSLWTATGLLVAHNGGQAIDLIGASTVILACSDLYANQAGDWTAPIAAQYGLNGNLSVDPQFCDAVHGDYHLRQDSPLSATNSGSCGTIGRFEWNCPAEPWAPFVPILRDVPSDQGGKLRVSWLKNTLDGPAVPIPVATYDVQRFGPTWLTIATMAAAATDSYSTVIDTPDIMTIGQPAPYSRYRLVARTANPSVVFESVVDSAFSIDNLPPPKPAAMLVDDLSYRYVIWTDPGLPDLATACVYRGTETGFTPDVPVGCPSDFYNEHDLGWYFYRVQFADIHGNLSEVSDELHGRWPTPVPDAVPHALKLYPCQPNPFNPRTTIKYDLPTAGPVRLFVFDVAGRLVRTLVDENVAQGSHEAAWDGRDASGREVGSGSYLARLEFRGKVETVRMVLVR